MVSFPRGGELVTGRMLPVHCIYCIAFCCTILHCAVLYCIVLHCTVLHCSSLPAIVSAVDSAVQYNVLWEEGRVSHRRAATPYCTALHCTALHPRFFPLPPSPDSLHYSRTQFSAKRLSNVHCTALHCTLRYTVQHCTTLQAK